jgi:hypothetical protein
MEATMKRIGLLALLVLTLAAVAPTTVEAQECKPVGDGRISGPLVRSEFYPGLSIITFSCGNPQVDFRIVFKGITHDKNNTGTPQTHSEWDFEWKDDRNQTSDTYAAHTATVTKLDDGSAPDPGLTFQEIDKLKADYMAAHPDWRVDSDKRSGYGGVSWLLARTVVFEQPSHQEGFYPRDPQFPDKAPSPKLVGPRFMTVRQMIDTRHNALYVLLAFLPADDGLDWIDSLQVAP